MKKYGMFFKNGKDIIHITHQKTTKQALNYFIKLKQLPTIEFEKIFTVVEIKK